MADQKLNILLIGPLYNPRKKNIGGAVRSFSYLMKYFEDKNIKYKVINTKMHFGRFSLITNQLHVFIKYFILVWPANVVFLNIGSNGIIFLAPILYLFSKMLGKKIVIRPFGGLLIEQYENSNKWEKWFFRKTVLSADLLLLQTRLLVSFFSSFTAKIEQFPTSRYLPDDQFLRGNEPYRKRLVYIGWIKETKGIEEILAVKKILDDSYTIDIYGPIMESKYKYFEKNNEVVYKGILESEETVLATLKKYDVLLLPTFHPGEGYTGIILEAYSLGLPVITTKWKALPEIVEQNKTGLLITPNSVTDLKKAILSINEENYSLMSRNARTYFQENFQTTTVMEKTVEAIRKLV